MDGDPVKTHPSSPALTLSQGMIFSSQSPHPTKRACVDLAAENTRVLKQEDPVDISTHAPNEVSKLDPPAVKRPPARYVASGAADLMSNNETGGVGQESQDGSTEEDIIRRGDRDKGDGITDDAKDGLQNDDDEVNGQEKNDSHLEAPRQKRTMKSVKEHIEELKAFKEKHGHVRVTEKHDKSLGAFCRNIRSSRRGNGTTITITEDRIKALDELGFDWGRTAKAKWFEERIEELKAFKAKHGHVRVTVKQDKSLGGFCIRMKAARRGKGDGTVINEDRIKALDELGFEWELKYTWFGKRIEELKAFKSKHGHVRVTVKQDKSLGGFCNGMRSARGRNGTGHLINEDLIKAMDELGFEWGHQGIK